MPGEIELTQPHGILVSRFSFHVWVQSPVRIPSVSIASTVVRVSVAHFEARRNGAHTFRRVTSLSEWQTWRPYSTQFALSALSRLPTVDFEAGVFKGGLGHQRGGCCFVSFPIVIADSLPRYFARRRSRACSHTRVGEDRCFCLSHERLCTRTFHISSADACQHERQMHCSRMLRMLRISSADACQHERASSSPVCAPHISSALACQHEHVCSSHECAQSHARTPHDASCPVSHFCLLLFRISSLALNLAEHPPDASFIFGLQNCC